MFEKWTNNYYYGKSGKGDFKKEDLPQTRWQLFWDMLRVRLSGLCRLNLTVCAAWLPLIFVIGYYVDYFTQRLQIMTAYEIYLSSGLLEEGFTIETVTGIQAMLTELGMDTAQFLATALKDCIAGAVLWCIPCILITGPVQAGLAYVTRNWARDEHAFAWSDFKDAVKANWKQSLIISAITSVMPVIVYTSWIFYGELANTQGVMFMVPQMLVVTIAIVWMLSLVFMYPIIVQYEIKTVGLIKNGLMLAIARLPQTVGIRLVTLVPAAIAIVALLMTNSLLALMILAAYYIIIGFCFTRFVYASYTNGVFDKFINSHMEGVEVNRGLSSDLDDDDDEDEPSSETLSE